MRYQALAHTRQGFFLYIDFAIKKNHQHYVDDFFGSLNTLPIEYLLDWLNQFMIAFNRSADQYADVLFKMNRE